ncbi:MAG: ribonuclease HII [archaeon]
MIVAGIDEAGKGPVLGPMVIAIFEVPEERLPELVSAGARDSKLLSERRREEVLGRLGKIGSWRKLVISAAELDARGGSLNTFEISKIAELINASSAGKVYIDSIEANGERLAGKVSALLKRKVELVAKPKADRDYPVVSAASIVAKVTREREIAELKKEYGEFGSGYPSDERTISYLKDFVRRNGFPPAIARRTWATTENIIKGLEESSQKRLPVD